MSLKKKIWCSCCVYEVQKVSRKSVLAKKNGTLYTDNGGEYIVLYYLLTSCPQMEFHIWPVRLIRLSIMDCRTQTSTYTQNGHDSTISCFNAARVLAICFGGGSVSHQSHAVVTIAFRNLFSNFTCRAPNYEKQRIFGCICFSWLRQYAPHKLDTKIIILYLSRLFYYPKCIFMPIWSWNLNNIHFSTLGFSWMSVPFCDTNHIIY